MALPPIPINHILDIRGVAQLTEEQLSNEPLLTEVPLRTFPVSQQWRIKELPQERYSVIYMLSTDDVNDLSIRFHHMVTTHKLPNNIFEIKEYKHKYQLDPLTDTYKTFQEKVKPFVIVTRLDTTEKLIYKIPYSAFRQHFFTLGVAK